jgi:hypothetical protein
MKYINIKLINRIIIFLSATLLLGACQKVIELDLKESERRFVIEANLDAGAGAIQVLVSKSGSFYQETDFDRISGATVNLSIANNLNYLLLETSPGTYAWDTILIQPGDTAFLTVALQTGELFSAMAICPMPTGLDSLELNPVVAPFSSDTIYQLLYNFQDPIGAKSYYRTKVRQNGGFLDGYLLFDDEGQDGEYIKIPFFGPPFEADDTLDVQLFVVDKEYYDYYVEVDDAGSAGLGSSVPYNPNGNFTPEVLGFFGIWYKTELTIITPL